MEARLIHDRDKDRVEKIAGLLEEIATLRAELARVREQWANTEIDRWTAVQELSRERERHQELRQATLMEAQKAVENERLGCHERVVNSGDYDGLSDGDISYSTAIRDAEDAIKQLLEPAPVDTGGNQ